MKNKVLILLGLVTLSGCEEYMNVQFDGSVKKNLVVEGMITTDTTSHKVMLSRSGDFFEKGPQQMEMGADVTITDGENTFVLNEAKPGIYKTDSTVYGVVGKTYTLNIKLKDNSEYSASEKIVGLPDIDSIVPKYDAGFDQNTGERTHGYYLTYYGSEPAGKGDYYMWQLYVNNVLYNDSLQESVFTSDDFVDGKYIKDFDLFFLPENSLEKDTTYTEVEMFSISKEYYDFLTGLMLETVWKGSPWDGPPANAVSNLSNGALGYFRACDRKVALANIIKQSANK